MGNDSNGQYVDLLLKETLDANVLKYLCEGQNETKLSLCTATWCLGQQC